MPGFEWSVKLGDVLTVLGALFVGAAILYNRGGSEARAGMSLSHLADQVTGMKDELKELAKVITTLAVQDTKITNLLQQFTMLQRNVEDLRRGAGFVSTPARGNVDGEYPKS